MWIIFERTAVQRHCHRLETHCIHDGFHGFGLHCCTTQYLHFLGGWSEFTFVRETQIWVSLFTGQANTFDVLVGINRVTSHTPIVIPGGRTIDNLLGGQSSQFVSGNVASRFNCSNSGKCIPRCTHSLFLHPCDWSWMKTIVHFVVQSIAEGNEGFGGCTAD